MVPQEWLGNEMGPDNVKRGNRVAVALCHAAIVLPVLGILVPVVIWVTLGKKSRYVDFQALQAAVYHSTLVVPALAYGACYVCAYCNMVTSFGGPIPAATTMLGESPPGAEGWIGGLLWAMILNVLLFGFSLLAPAVWAAYVGYGLYGAVATLRGKDFRYVFLGPRLERYLEGTSAPSKAEP